MKCFYKIFCTISDRLISQKEVKILQDANIIEKIKRGDETAMNAVINQYARLLWTIADAVLEKAGTVQDVEECVADVFIYLWQHAEKYHPERGKLKVWLSIITRSKAINRYRKLTKESALAFDEKQLLELEIPQCAPENSQKDLLITALHTLNEEEQDILIRRYYYEQKPKTIALALDMPVKRVENLLYRAKQKLRQRLTNPKEVLS